MFAQSSENKSNYVANSALSYIYVGLTLSVANPIDFVRFRMQTMQ